MAKTNKIARSKDDLKRELTDQLQLLRLACESFDRGIEATGKSIALSLRILLHLRGQSRALLDQLGYRNGKFISTAIPLNPNNIMVETPLLVMSLSTEGIKWLPLVASHGIPSPSRPIPFSDWWLELILKDTQDRKFSRMELVKHVADTDGGAHVDPELDEAYMDLSRRNSLGWTSGSDRRPPQSRPELACMRQIAHELLCTLQKYAPELGNITQPIVPSLRSS